MTDSSVTKGVPFENARQNCKLNEILFNRILQAKSITNLATNSNSSTEDIYNSICVLDDVLQNAIDEAEQLQGESRSCLKDS